MNERVGAQPWATRVRIEYGRLLAAGSSAADRRRGRELVTRGRRDAERLGMDASHPTMTSSPTAHPPAGATPSR
jgi:hypothetical protein